jgi:hypothetical protein
VGTDNTVSLVKSRNGSSVPVVAQRRTNTHIQHNQSHITLRCPPLLNGHQKQKQQNNAAHHTPKGTVN